MSKASHLGSAALRLIANMCLTRVAAVIGATTSAFTTTGVGAATVNGFMVALAAQTNTALSALAAADMPAALANWLQPSGLAGFYVQPANTTVYYVIGVTAGGTWKVVQGTYDGQVIGAVTGYPTAGKSVIPDVPDAGFTPVTVMKVASGGATFTPGTTALTGIATFKDVGVLPVDATF
jgi:hypothetical protein